MIRESRALSAFLKALIKAFLRALTISENWPARPVQSRTEFHCQSDLSCQISQCINVILCSGGFAGKSRQKAHFTFKTTGPADQF